MPTAAKLALQPLSRECSVCGKGIESSGSEGSSMARRRYQNGCVFLRGKNPVWVGRYREDVIGPDGHPIRVLKSIVLGAKRELPTKRLAERRMELELARVNSPAYRPGRVATR